VARGSGAYSQVALGGRLVVGSLYEVTGLALSMF